VTPKPKNRTECISIILGQCSSWIKSVIHEPREYRDAQDRLWRDKAFPALTKLIMSRKALTSIDIDILIITVTFFVIIITTFLIIIIIIYYESGHCCVQAPKLPQASNGTAQQTGQLPKPNAQARPAASGHVQVAAKGPATQSPAPAAAVPAKKASKPKLGYR